MLVSANVYLDLHEALPLSSNTVRILALFPRLLATYMRSSHYFTITSAPQNMSGHAALFSGISRQGEV
jgi:hypothetical protein